jgi:hypothetical protein
MYQYHFCPRTLGLVLQYIRFRDSMDFFSRALRWCNFEEKGEPVFKGLCIWSFEKRKNGGAVENLTRIEYIDETHPRRLFPSRSLRRFQVVSRFPTHQYPVSQEIL